MLFLYEYVITVVQKQLLGFEPLQLSDSGCPEKTWRYQLSLEVSGRDTVHHDDCLG
jgi:hypothetical protein